MKLKIHWRRLWRLLLVAILVAPSLPGMVRAQDPPPGSENTFESSETIILSDGNFLYPKIDVEEFLQYFSGDFKNVWITSPNGILDTMANSIKILGSLYGVSPEVLFALAETSTQALTNTTLDLRSKNGIFGNSEIENHDLWQQIEQAAQVLSAGFYMHYNNQYETRSPLRDGSIVELKAGNAATYAISYYFSLYAETEMEWRRSTGTGEGSFYQTFASLFGDPTSGMLYAAHPSAQDLLSAPTMRLPWQGGEKWWYIGGPHRYSSSVDTTIWPSVDFQPNKGANGCSPKVATGSWVAAVAAGKVILVGNYEVVIDHDGDGDSSTGWQTSYFHVANIKVSNEQRVDQGALLGNPSCYGGNAVGRHLHFSIKFQGVFQDIDSAVLSGWTIIKGSKEYDGKIKKGDIERDASLRNPLTIESDNYLCPKPQSASDVILYRDSGFGCGGLGEGEGYIRISPNTSGIVFLPSNFGASSIHVPFGSIATLYYRGNTACPGWTARRWLDDDSFLGDIFADTANAYPPQSIPIPVNDNIGSVSVEKNYVCLPNASVSTTQSAVQCVPNNPPHVPQLIRPGDSYQSTTYRAPELCWTNPGDPNGDEVKFYVEIYNSPVNTNSGWTSNTCWRPAALDYQYHQYYWRVKARDPAGAQSAWSSTRTFSILPPNRPPSIAFNAANGDSFPTGVINTRERNWTFQGTAYDPEGRLSHIQWQCSGDNCGALHSQSGVSNWTYTRHNLLGRNTLYFQAYDAEGYYSNSRSLILNIDLAPPTTRISLNGESNPVNWPTWFTAPVAVHFAAIDGNTGNARVGVQAIHYRVNGGAWQTHGGESAAFTLNSDGVHTVEYYAVDLVGNVESLRSVTVQVDQTPPAPPTGIVETHGVAHNVWQRDHNAPTFTWEASTDATSGVWGYQFYFGKDPNGINYHTFLADQPRVWTPQPGGVHTGAYYLRGRARDVAGNWSVWTDLFTFRYDETPPENPTGVTHATGITNTVWQRLTNIADFSWPISHDEGSGIQGYHVYWGPNEIGESATFITTNAFADLTPLCDTVAVCTGYLRLRSVDNVNNLANEWSTGFVLRYDNVPPEVDFTFNEGITRTDQTHVTLNINATDEGSGVVAMRVSPDGQAWLPWEVYTDTRAWVIPGVSRLNWPVYVQVRDGVGLESTVVSRTVYLDVNRMQPHSDNYRLFDHILSAGAGAYTSTVYSGRGTVGQLADSAVVTSANFRLAWGYEAGSQALPLIIPGYETYNYVNGIFASGTGATALTSANFRMLGTFNETALPTNTTTLSSPAFTHQPGFLAARPSVRPVDPLTQTVGPPPPMPPMLACETPSISINHGADYTAQLTVTLSLCAPNAVEMQVRNTVTPTQVWEPYAITKTWMLPDSGPQTSARFVYAAFKDASGEVHQTYFDDIIYDTGIPSITLTLNVPLLDIPLPIYPDDEYPLAHTLAQTPATSLSTNWLSALPANAPLLNATGAITIYVGNMDDNSGVAELQFSDNVSFTNALWEPYTPIKLYTPPGGEGITTLYARARDGAGNVSSVISATFIYDTHGPAGGVSFSNYVIGPQTVTETLYLTAWDDWSEVTDMRVSTISAFTDTTWQPYTYTLVVPLSITTQSAITMYAQYRDARGNVSAIYSDVVSIDTAPPVVYVDVPPSTSLTRTLTIYAYDELSEVANVYISNDPLMVQDVLTLTYPLTITWGFNESRIAFVQAVDGVGNVSEPYPVYAREFDNKVFLPIVIKQE